MMNATLDSATIPNHADDGRHLAFIDGLRGIAALFVVFHHAFLQVFYRAPATGVLGYFVNWLVYGRFAVDAFIVLSGYCLMLPVSAGKPFVLRKYVARRVHRILPPFYCALALSVCLGVLVISEKTGTLWDVSLPVTAGGVVANLFMLQDVWHTLEINPVFWSLAVEAKIYIVFPLLVASWSRLGGGVTSVLTIAGGAILWWITCNTSLRGLTAYYLCLFTFGMIACDWSQRRELLWRVPFLLAAIVLGLIVAFLCWNWGWQIVLKRFADLDVLVGLTTSCVLVHARKTNFVSRNLGSRPLVFVGTFAYSLYLTHAPLLQLVSRFIVMPRRLSNAAALATMFAFVPVVVAIAFVFFLFCERPFMSARLRRSVTVEQRDGI